MYYHDIDSDYSYETMPFQRNYDLMIEKFPFLKGIKITHQWGGRIGVTADLLPSIGCTGEHKNTYYSMGYCGHGVAFSLLAGKMIAELMSGRNNELTNHALMNRALMGVSSKSLMFIVLNGYKLYLQLLDRLLGFGRKSGTEA